jgi:hypothetical protein
MTFASKRKTSFNHGISEAFRVVSDTFSKVAAAQHNVKCL